MNEPTAAWLPLTALPPVVAGAAYVLCHYHLDATSWRERAPSLSAAGALFARRLSCGVVLLLGALAAAAMADSDTAWTTALGVYGEPSALRALLGGLGLTLVFAPIAATSARSAGGQRWYPELRDARWTPGLRVRNAATWGVFLFGYEAWFRGFWLLWLATLTDVGTALGIHTFIYAIAHLPKPNASETWSTLLMGFLFGAVTLWSGSIIAAWLSHWAIAVASETAASYAATDAARSSATDAARSSATDAARSSARTSSSPPR